MTTRQDFEDLLKRLDRVEKYDLNSEQATQVLQLRKQITGKIQNIDMENIMTEISQRTKKLETRASEMYGDTKQKLQNVVTEIKDTMEVYDEMRREEELQDVESDAKKIGLRNRLRQRLISIREKIRNFVDDVKAFSEEKKEYVKVDTKELEDSIEKIKEKTKEIQEQSAEVRSEKLKALTDKLKKKAEELKKAFSVSAEDYDAVQNRVEEIRAQYGM